VEEVLKEQEEAGG